MARARYIAVLAPLVALAAWCGGCTATIVAPIVEPGERTAPVFVTVAGYHSSLILPRAEGGMVEYAYGDWGWFAKCEQSVGDGLGALFSSPQATLGRRFLDRRPEQPGLAEAVGAERLVRIEAPRDRVERLERDLDRRFSARLESLIFSRAQGLYFVKDDEHYSLGNNCNHATAEWLEQLGCKVEGFRAITRFEAGDREEPSKEAVAAARDRRRTEGKSVASAGDAEHAPASLARFEGRPTGNATR